ncbi:DALR anticodon-binding domain-containing protein [Streptomyces sp. E1N211]|uniref:DALR anticodon-binding domain-containing protein n=1 Tax=Streptomyces sp. E1N211 TaxID=1851876 RepID=UPI000EF65C38|nr:DALR anticodon-binding domain-containing protein [Streptomyces sp. E1N211]
MTDTSGDDRRLPPALAELARTPIDYADGEGIDFEPYDAFDSAEATTEWLRQWTGNPELDGNAFRVFGQDGTGGLAALWRVRTGRPLVEQPVVFLSSEGERGVVAGLADHPRVLAATAAHRAPDRLARHLVAVADALAPLLPSVLPLGDEKPSAAHRARLALAEAAGTVLAGGLSLLGIDAPEHL